MYWNVAACMYQVIVYVSMFVKILYQHFKANILLRCFFFSCYAEIDSYLGLMLLVAKDIADWEMKVWRNFEDWTKFVTRVGNIDSLGFPFIDHYSLKGQMAMVLLSLVCHFLWLLCVCVATSLPDGCFSFNHFTLLLRFYGSVSSYVEITLN